MRKPSPPDQPESDEQVPEGGGALQRVQQDRTARGLGGVRKSDELVLTDPEQVAERQPGKKSKKKKPAKDS